MTGTVPNKDTAVLASTQVKRRQVCGLLTKAGLACALNLGSLSAFAQRGISTITGDPVPRLREMDRLVAEYLSRNRSVPGASLAIGESGRVLYARGFGWGDTERREPVQPNSLFRIASVSKSLTSAAILLLAQQGRLQLTDAAFPLLGIEVAAANKKHVDPRLEQITLHHLLCHSGGWTRQTAANPFETWRGFDPMFFPVEIAKSLGVPSPASPANLVRFMVTRPLDFDPGSRYAYSNFGYCVLGRVIEKRTGMPYGEFVREELLAPMGIHDAQIGKSLLSGRAPGEVRYSPSDGPAATSKSVFGGPDVPWCYGGFELEAMDSHGGWIATASDLVRFASSLEAANPRGPLTAQSIQKLFARPAETGFAANGVELPAYYGYGWHVQSTIPEGTEAWHDGLFSGTSALVMRRRNGIAWALLLNTDHDDARQVPTEVLAGRINRLLDRLAL